MSTHRKRAIHHRLTGVVIVALAVCLVSASDASANDHEALPEAYTSFASYKSSDPSIVAARHAGEMIAADASVGKRRAPLHVRYRKIKLLSFQREVELLREDVIVKVQSPGRRKSIMMVELKF